MKTQKILNIVMDITLSVIHMMQQNLNIKQEILSRLQSGIRWFKDARRKL
ncbi:MAG: hypothetical protein QXT99_06270 [Candidatus Nitrosotenuis sp.]